MATRIIYTAPDGSMHVVSPAIEDLEAVMKKSIPAGATNVQVVDSSVIPADRTYRNGWKAGKGKIDFDMGKCREIHKDMMRVARVPLMKNLDVEYMRADERGDAATKAQIATKKQTLRDITDDPAISAASTPEQLKAVWPACLR